MLPYFSSKGATCKYVECGFYDIEIYGYTVSINQYINHGSNKTYWRLRLGIYSCHWHFVFERFVRTFNLFSQCACMFGYWFLMDFVTSYQIGKNYLVICQVVFLSFQWFVFVFVVYGALCFGVYIIFVFRIPVSLPPFVVYYISVVPVFIVCLLSL